LVVVVITELSTLRGQRLLLAASTGGHLTQLVRLFDILGLSPECEWVTFKTPQSEALLAGRIVHYVDYISPRDYRGVVKATGPGLKLLKRLDGCVSTGAGLALACLPSAAALGKPAVYIESISRVHGPSMTGRLLMAVPGVELFTQHAAWSSSRWNVGPSVLDRYEAHETRRTTPRRIFVTLGTIRPYRFDRLVDFTCGVTGSDAEIVWQLGATLRKGLPGRVFEQVPSWRFDELVSGADVVITHAGVGSLLQILDLGKYPLVMARRSSMQEHVDNHQEQILELMSSRGLVRAIFGTEDAAVLELATGIAIRMAPRLPR
jgi:UDP-N-acetylglucosamine--N-acetylmuramyl-(pentapeptide) pyrophosphoryl-undecaprenol N-acetylglucosamine transferase